MIRSTPGVQCINIFVPHGAHLGNFGPVRHQLAILNNRNQQFLNVGNVLRFQCPALGRQVGMAEFERGLMENVLVIE